MEAKLPDPPRHAFLTPGGVAKIRLADSISQGFLLFASLAASYLSGRLKYSVILVLVIYIALWAYLNRNSELLEQTIRSCLAGRSLIAAQGWLASNAKQDEEIPNAQELLDKLDDDSQPSEEILAKIAELLGKRSDEFSSFSAEVAVLNSFVTSAWPQISLHLEKKVRSSLRDALSTRQEKSSGFIKKAELRYVRFQHGVPVIEDVRSYIHGWSDDLKDCLMIEMKFKWEGLLRIGINLGLLVGSFNVTLGVTNLELTLRLTLTERTYYPPFIKFINLKVIDDPHLLFSLHIGAFDPSKIPLVEHFLKDKLLKQIRKSVWNFAFRGTQTPKLLKSVVPQSMASRHGSVDLSNVPASVPDVASTAGTAQTPAITTAPPTNSTEQTTEDSKEQAPPKEPLIKDPIQEKIRDDRENFHGGILHLLVDGIDRNENQNGVPEEIQDGSLIGGVFEEQKTEWMKCSVQLGDSERGRRETAFSNYGTWSEQFQFLIGHKDIVMEYEEQKTKTKQSKLRRLFLDIKVNELCVLISSTHVAGKKPKRKEVKKHFKARIDVLKALGTKLDEDVVQHAHIALSPKDGGYLRLRFLWQPVLSVYSVSHSIICPGIKSWPKEKKQSQPIGVINVQIIKAEGLDVPEKNVLNVKIAYGVSEELAEKTVQFTKYSYNTKNPFWDESFDFIAGNFFDALWLTIFDYQNKNKVIGRLKLNCWNFIYDKLSLNLYESFQLTDSDGKPIPNASILVGFIVYPTISVDCYSKRFAFETMSSVISPKGHRTLSTEKLREKGKAEAPLEKEIEDTDAQDDLDALLEAKDDFASRPMILETGETSAEPEPRISQKVLPSSYSAATPLTRMRSDELLFHSEPDTPLSGTSGTTPPTGGASFRAEAVNATKMALNETVLQFKSKFAGLVTRRRGSTNQDKSTSNPSTSQIMNESSSEPDNANAVEEKDKEH